MGHISENIKKKIFCVSVWIYTIYYSMGHILEKIKKKNFFVSVWIFTIRLHILEKKNFFLRFCVDLYYKDIVWIIFWRKLKKKIRFCMDLHNKSILWIIFWRKLKIFFFSFLYGFIL
jgi:hypothetical protein